MNKLLKVVYLIDTLEVGGAEKSLVDIAIRNKHFETIFITIYKGNFLAKVLESNNIKVYSLDIKGRYAFKEALAQLKPLIKEINPDLIHATLFRSDIISRRLKKRLEVPLINSFVNNSYSKERYSKLSFPNKIKLFAFQLYDRITAINVDYFISNSETIKHSNALAINVSLDKIRVIYRGRNPQQFGVSLANEIDDLKRDLQIEDKKVILNVSRLLDRKGQLDLITAFSNILESHPNLILLIAGEGQYRPILEKAIYDLKISASVKLLGNRSDIPKLLQLADFFVFPSHYEGLPGALIEAMFAGKIIVASDISENTECVNSLSAVLFKKGNIRDFEEKLKYAIENEADLIKLSIEAKQQAVEKFDIDSVVNQYIETYNSVIKSFKKW